MTKKDTIDATVNAAIEKFGKIDVLINNAGYCLRGAVEECTEEEIYAEFNTNFFGAVRMIQAVLPHMRKAGSAFYGAAKCALEGLSCGLRKEVEPLGIKVMVVEPGPFKTDIIQRPDAPHHILLGSMAVEIGEKFVKDRAEEIQKWKEASESLDA